MGQAGVDEADREGGVLPKGVLKDRSDPRVTRQGVELGRLGATPRPRVGARMRAWVTGMGGARSGLGHPQRCRRTASPLKRR